MPNWTSNIIRVEGPEAAMREFLNHFKGDDEPFDFNRIIPMPAILRHTGSGARTFDGRTHRSWYIIDPDLPFGDPAYDANERPFTPEEKAALAHRPRELVRLVRRQLGHQMECRADQDHITHSMRIRIGEPAEQGRGS